MNISSTSKAGNRANARDFWDGPLQEGKLGVSWKIVAFSCGWQEVDISSVVSPPAEGRRGIIYYIIRRHSPVIANTVTYSVRN